MIFLLCFEGFWLININPRHQPVKLPPGKIPDLRLLPGPLITAADRQALIDQNEAVRFPDFATCFILTIEKNVENTALGLYFL